MNITAIYKKLFSREENPEAYVDVESRRRFLKGAAGLATIAVVSGAGGILRTLNKSENDRLLDAIRSGIVKGQTFVLDRTSVLIGLVGVHFINCYFIANKDFIGDNLIELKGCKGTMFDSCFFESKKNIDGSLLVFS